MSLRKQSERNEVERYVISVSRPCEHTRRQAKEAMKKEVLLYTSFSLRPRAQSPLLVAGAGFEPV